MACKRSSVRLRYPPLRSPSEAVLMYFVYIIYSQRLDRFYIGYTHNLDIRLQQHNSGISVFTSKASDWVLCFSECFPTRIAAQKREREIKNKKSRKYLEWIIK